MIQGEASLTAEDAEVQHTASERERPELTVKRYEEIYHFALKAYDEENAFSDLLEKRIFNFLTVSLVLLGLSFTLISSAAQEVLLKGAFFLSLCVCIGTTLFAVVCFYFALRLAKFKLPPVGRKPIDYLRERTTYFEALEQLSRKHMEAAEFNAHRSRTMSRWSSAGYWSLFVAIMLFVFAASYYVAFASADANGQDSQPHISSERSR